MEDRDGPFTLRQQLACTFSMILPSPTDRPLQAGLMTTTFAVLIVEVLKQFFPAQDFRYKWVNDIYLNRKKLAEF